jgi:4-carboxymuconolactone decarboxylase
VTIERRSTIMKRRQWYLAMALCVAVVSASVSTAGQASRAKTIPDQPGRARPAQLSSPRLTPLAESQWTDVHKRIVAQYVTDGRPGNALRTLLNIPDLAENLMVFQSYQLKDSTLSPRHRELLILRTSWLLNSNYIWSEHVPLARTAGLTAAEVRRVAAGPDAKGWSPFEATLLRLADQLFRNSSVNDAVYTALTAEYDIHHTMDAVMTVANFTTLGLLYNALGIQPDSWNVDRIPTDVPYRVVVPTREAALTVARVDPVPGTGLAVSRTFDRHPALAAARRGSNYVNRESKLEPRYRELMILRTGWDCQSEYEWAQHVGSVGRAREMGMPIENIARGPDAPGWNPTERALLTAADELYRDSFISDRTWSDLSARFDVVMVVNALISAANYRQVSMSLNAFGVQLAPGDERFPTLGSK